MYRMFFPGRNFDSSLICMLILKNLFFKTLKLFLKNLGFSKIFNIDGADV